MSEPSECELINKIFINVQQVCYIFEFKIRQEICNRSFFLSMSLERSCTYFSHLFRNFFQEERLRFLQRNRIIAFDNILHRKIKFSNGRNAQVLTSKIKHTDTLLRLNTEHTESSETEHMESRLRQQTAMPSLSFVRSRQYRTTLTYQSFLTFEIEDTEDYLYVFLSFFIGVLN